MFDDLKGKRVLITGSSKGIGLAAAKAFLAQGAKVGINGRDPSFDASVLKDACCCSGEFEYFQEDLSTSAACKNLVDRFVKRFTGIDVVINNAGALGGRRVIDDIDDAFFDQVINVNMRSAFMTTKYAMPYLRESAKASGTTSSVILVGSIAGYNGGGPGAALYGAAKAWLHTVQKNWVSFHSSEGIRFNVLSPGTVDTAFHADKNEAARTQISNGIPMKRFGTSEEMAPTFLYLASHQCSAYVTGQIININGGQYMP